MEMSPGDTRKRVKVYQLDNSGKWEDKGTGFVSCTYIEEYELHGLMVRSEENGEIILRSKLFSAEVYQRQQETLIVWAEPNTSLDLAISFQDSGGCQDVWDFIMKNQADTTELIELPEVNLENLEIIKDTIDPCLPQQIREKIVHQILREDYLKLLLDLFDQLEQANDTPNLYNQFTIFKNLILFNDTSLFELLFGEDNFLRIMGVLEYDQEIPEQNRIKHREFLSNVVIFKEVVKFSSESLIGVIHQTFRIHYLKDVVLPRVLDDVTFSTLNSLIYFNNSEIVTNIQKDNTLQKIFTQIHQSPAGSQELRDLMLFLQELCGLAKNLQHQNKVTYFQNLSSLDLFKTLSTTLSDETAQIRISTTEIILSTLSFDTRMLRNYIISNSSFLSQLINGFIKDNDIGVKNQIVEIIKVLLESDTAEMNEFFKLFYEKGIYELVSPLSGEQLKSEDPTIPGDPSSNLESFIQHNVIELIIYCIKHHSFRIKHFIVNENIAQKILVLTSSNERYIVLGAIRFFRCLVSMKDDLYNNHMIQENLFDPIISIFKQNISRYNLLNSAIIELLQFIYKENIKVLVIHLVERYRELFESITYTDVLSQMILKYEQIKDSYESPEIPCNDSNLYRDRLEGSDDAYFNASDESDEERYLDSNFETSNASSMLGDENKRNDGRIAAGNVKLVDYDDDEIDSDDDQQLLVGQQDESVVCNGEQPLKEGEEEEDLLPAESKQQYERDEVYIAASPEEKPRTPKRKLDNGEHNESSSEHHSFSVNEKSVQIVFNLNSVNNSSSSSSNEENESHHQDQAENTDDNNNDHSSSNHKSSTLNGDEEQPKHHLLKSHHNNNNNNNNDNEQSQQQDNCTNHHLSDKQLENGISMKRVKIMKDDSSTLGLVDQEQ